MNEQSLVSRINRLNLRQYDLSAPDAPVLYFLHIPKTAGISVRAALTTRFWPHQTFQGQSWSELLACTPEQLAQYRLFFGHFYTNLYHLLPKQPLTITVVRDPIARALSHFRSIWLKPEHYLHEEAHQAGSLMKFLQHPIGRALLTNFQTRLLAVELNPATLAPSRDLSEPYVLEGESELVTVPDASESELLARAKIRLDSFAFVGLTERLRESLWLLDYIFGWWPAADIPRENVTPVNEGYEGISPEAIGLLRELTSLDAELYCYAEQRFNSDYSQMMTKFIEQQAVDSQPALSKQHIDVAFDYRLPGTGWYPPDQDRWERVFRWLGPEPTASVVLPLPADRPVTITGCILLEVVPGIIKNLTLKVEHTFIPLTIEATTKYSYTFSGVIPPHAAAETGLTHLIFRVDWTVSPHEVDPESTDTRLVSLAFSWLRLSYHDGLPFILNRAFRQFTGTN